MAKEPAAGKIKMNPLISRLLDAGTENAIALTGFVAPAGRKGYIRLFPALNNMSKSIEIAESDIVATVELPKSGLGAVAIWVKRDAALQHQLIERADTQGGELTSVRRAGLRMKVPPQARAPTCEYYCDGTHCVPCTCQCLAQPQ
jgi:hypothetical protein